MSPAGGLAKVIAGSRATLEEAQALALPETLGVPFGPALQHCLTGDLTRPPDRP